MRVSSSPSAAVTSFRSLRASDLASRAPRSSKRANPEATTGTHAGEPRSISVCANCSGIAMELSKVAVAKIRDSLLEAGCKDRTVGLSSSVADEEHEFTQLGKRHVDVLGWRHLAEVQHGRPLRGYESGSPWLPPCGRARSRNERLRRVSRCWASKSPGHRIVRHPRLPRACRCYGEVRTGDLPLDFKRLRCVLLST